MFPRNKLHRNPCSGIAALRSWNMTTCFFFPSNAPPSVCLVLYLHYRLQKLPQNVQACTTLRLDFFCSPWWEFILTRIYLDFNSLWEGMYYLFSFQLKTLEVPTGCLFYNPSTVFFSWDKAMGLDSEVIFVGKKVFETFLFGLLWHNF